MKSKKLVNIIITSALIISFTLIESCSKEDVDTPYNFYWNQTGCADPWDIGSSSNDDLKSAVRTYLKNYDISVKKLKISGEFEATVCNACFCLTGKRIYIYVEQKYVGDMKLLGFIQLEE